MKANGFIKGFSSIAADSNADQALLYTGKAAMMLHGGWIYGSMKDNAADFVKSGQLGYTNFPSVSGGKGDPANIVGNPGQLLLRLLEGHRADRRGCPRSTSTAAVLGHRDPGLIDAGDVPVVKGIDSSSGSGRTRTS